MLAHQSANPFVVGDRTLLPQRGADTTPAIRLKLVGDRDDRRDQRGVVHPSGGAIVIGGARDTHQLASPYDGHAAGPTMADVVSLLGRGAERCAPLRNSSSSACLPTRRSSAAIRAS